MKRYLDEEMSHRYLDCILSLSRYSQKQYDEALVLANYSHAEPTMTTLDEINDNLEQIQKTALTLGGHGGEYVFGMTEAMKCFAQVMQGDTIDYLTRVKRIQQLEMKRIPEENFCRLEDKIAEPLRNLGYQGQIGEMIASWINDTAIAPEQVTIAAKEFLDNAKAETLAQIVDLPPEDGIDAVSGIRGVFWSGFSRYLGNFRGDLTFNLDRPWARPLFANILCHEGYPGHQTFYCRWDQLFLRGDLPLEGAFYAYNTPTNALFEGAPETGLHFLGWDDETVETPYLTSKDKTVFALGRHVLDLQRMYQNNACFMVNVENASQKEAVAYMTGSGFLTEVEANNVYRFFTHPVQSTYYPCYYYGRWMIYEAYEAWPKDRRNEFFRLLYDTPQTTDTFIKNVQKVLGETFAPFAKC